MFFFTDFRWNITIRTTDLDKAFFEKIFEFEILNANDPPKAAYVCIHLDICQHIQLIRTVIN